MITNRASDYNVPNNANIPESFCVDENNYKSLRRSMIYFEAAKFTLNWALLDPRVNKMISLYPILSRMPPRNQLFYQSVALSLMMWLTKHWRRTKT